MKARNNFFFLFVAITLLSCSEAPFYEKAYSFDNKEWKQDHRLKFEVDIMDLDKEYDFILSFRTTTDYNYNNLWFFMKTEAPDGSNSREPFEVKVSNPDGSWIGTKTGSIVETPLVFSRRKLPLKGKYKFVIEQGITESKVDEILDVVFTVDLAGTK
jgi:gliding motility-associated lipoprotein GldH